MIPHVFRLAARDLRHEWVLSFCLMAALSAVMVPLMLLFGLKFGTIETLRHRLIADPNNLEVRLYSSNTFDWEWFGQIGQDPRVAFVIPNTRQIASSVRLERVADGRNASRFDGGKAGSAPGKEVVADGLPTGPGDPFLLAYKTPVPGVGELVLSAACAEGLGVEAGGTVQISATRTRNGRGERVSEQRRVAGVLPPAATGLPEVYLPLELLEAIEDYRAAVAVPSRQWEGEPRLALPRYDGAVLLFPREPDEAQRRRLTAQSGFSTLERLEPRHMSAIVGWRVGEKGDAAKGAVYLLKNEHNTVGEDAVRELRKMASEMGAEVFPWVRPVEGFLSAPGVEGNAGSPVWICALGADEKQARRWGITPAPPWGERGPDEAPCPVFWPQNGEPGAENPPVEPPPAPSAPRPLPGVEGPPQAGLEPGLFHAPAPLFSRLAAVVPSAPKRSFVALARLDGSALALPRVGWRMESAGLPNRMPGLLKRLPGLLEMLAGNGPVLRAAPANRGGARKPDRQGRGGEVSRSRPLPPPAPAAKPKPSASPSPTPKATPPRVERPPTEVPALVAWTLCMPTVLPSVSAPSDPAWSVWLWQSVGAAPGAAGEPGKPAAPTTAPSSTSGPAPPTTKPEEPPPPPLKKMAETPGWRLSLAPAAAALRKTAAAKPQPLGGLPLPAVAVGSAASADRNALPSRPRPTVFVPSQWAGLLRAAREDALRYEPAYRRLLVERGSHNGFRLYARTIDDVKPLEDRLKAEGLSLRTQSARIAQVKLLDRHLGLIFSLIGAVGILGGLAALVTNLYASVERKRLEIGVLRLLGVRGLLFFPVCQSLLLVAGAFGISLGVFEGVAAVINGLFAQTENMKEGLRAGEAACHLPWELLGMALGGALVCGALAATLALLRVMRASASEALHSE